MNEKIAIIGLGYVGLPLAVEFGKLYDTIGLDINQKRVQELKDGHDFTLEVDEAGLKSAKKLQYKSDFNDIKDCNYFIVTVPTPINKTNQPDLTPIIKSTESISKILKKGDIVIYESTVYPGVTEEICVPILEEGSGLKFNQDFFCGYSPERINPGDKKHTVTKILKVTSGSTPKIAKIVDELYKTIITAGTYQASSIKVAEAAKVIENTQRDLNIAFVNELSIIFNKLGIDTTDVLEAAGTKWNFLKFKPGLVGGHCISVDPYYLTHKAQEIGYNPEIILAGRRLNDNMGSYVANQVIKLMIKKGSKIGDSKVLMLGITFKENCPDIRNSGVVSVIEELKEFGCSVDVYDPWASPDEVKHEYNLDLIQNSKLNIQNYNAIVLAVAHDKFKEIEIEKSDNLVVFDIKSFLDKNKIDGRL